MNTDKAGKEQEYHIKRGKGKSRRGASPLSYSVKSIPCGSGGVNIELARHDRVDANPRRRKDRRRIATFRIATSTLTLREGKHIRERLHEIFTKADPEKLEKLGSMRTWNQWQEIMAGLKEEAASTRLRMQKVRQSKGPD